MLVALLIAAAASTGSLTLGDAFARAGEHNLALQAARSRVPIARAGIVTAGAVPNPTFSLSYGRDEPAFIGGMTVGLPVFGQLSAATAVARAQVPVAEAEADLRAVELHASVRRSYFLLAAAQARAQLAAETARVGEDLAALTRVKFEAGAAPRLDADQAKLAARRVDADRVAAESARAAGVPELNNLLGEPADLPLEATDAVTALPSVPVLNEMLARLDKHPSLLGIQRERDAALARSRQARVDLRPAPDATVELSTLPGAPGGLGLRGTLAFGAPVFSQNQGRIAVAEAEADEAALRERAVRAQLTARIRAGWVRLSAAVTRARFFLDEQVPAATQVLNLARVAYQEGKTPLISVLQAQADVAAARGQAVDAASEAQQTLADIEEASGVAF